MLTVGSLFAGIGGFDLGLERAGMRVIWQSEIDPYASAVLRKHWPHVPNHGDIRSIHAGNVERPDVLCGGFPCQPFSHAGKQAGAKDDRHLWPEMRRVIDELGPSFVVGENVTGIIGMELDAVLSDLEAIGYTARTLVIPAVAVDAPHRRDRVWIIAGNARRTDADGDRRHVEPESAIRARRAPAPAIRDRDRDRDREPACAVDDEAQGLPRNASHADHAGCGEQRRSEPIRTKLAAIERGSRWSPEPDVGRVAHGIPARVDRLRCLGNAIVPQIAEIIGRAIVRVT